MLRCFYSGIKKVTSKFHDFIDWDLLQRRITVYYIAVPLVNIFISDVAISYKIL